MKRLTITLPDDLAAALHEESERRNVPPDTIIQEAVEGLVVAHRPRRELRFTNLGASGEHDTSERIEEILAREWGERVDDGSIAPLPSANRKTDENRQSA